MGEEGQDVPQDTQVLEQDMTQDIDDMGEEGQDVTQDTQALEQMKVDKIQADGQNNHQGRRSGRARRATYNPDYEYDKSSIEITNVATNEDDNHIILNYGGGMLVKGHTIKQVLNIYMPKK